VISYALASYISGNALALASVSVDAFVHRFRKELAAYDGCIDSMRSLSLPVLPVSDE